MFDFSFSELLVVSLVAVIFIKPEDLPQMVKTAGGVIGKIKQFGREISGVVDEVKKESGISEAEAGLKKIVDLDGELRPAYDISEIDKLIGGDEGNKR